MALIRAFGREEIRNAWQKARSKHRWFELSALVFCSKSLQLHFDVSADRAACASFLA